MKLIISGRNIDLTEAIKNHVQEKLHRLQEHYDFVRDVHVYLSVEKNPRAANPHKAECTVQVSGGIFRFEASSENLYASIDLLVDKVDRGLNKYKQKLLMRSKSGRSAGGESIRMSGRDEALAADRASDPELLALDEDDLLTFTPWADRLEVEEKANEDMAAKA
jgi:putative sigma-54 modulation protein